MTQEFNGSDFIKALAKGALRNQIVCEGMTKLNEHDPNSILFADTLDCTNWIPIPVKIIDKVEFISNVSCKDHQHPYVRIHLKLPTDNPEAEVFSRLLAAKPPTYAWPTEIGLTSAPGPTQEVAPGSFDFPAIHPSLQSAGSPGPQVGSVYCCHVELQCITVAVTTASGGITFVRKCFWVISNCRPGPCPRL